MPLSCVVSKPQCRTLLATATFLSFITVGCGGSIQAPTTSDGSKIQILLFFDANPNPSADTEEKAVHSEIATWMADDIRHRLADGGYEVKKAESPDFTPQKGRYLMTVQMTKFIPAGATSREEAGLGAGTTEIETRSELFMNSRDKPSLRINKGEVSARDWHYCAEQITSHIATEMSKAINKRH